MRVTTDEERDTATEVASRRDTVDPGGGDDTAKSVSAMDDWHPERARAEPWAKERERRRVWKQRGGRAIWDSTGAPPVTLHLRSCSASSRLPSRPSQPGNVRAPLTLSVAIFLLDALLQRILPPITAPVPSGSVEADEQETPGVNEQWEETVVLLPSSSSSQSAAPSGGVARQTR
jgi:hypothetical protein